MCNAVCTGEEMKLTNTQVCTLRMIAGGISHIPPNNKSAQVLKKAGLACFKPPLGWLLTQEGHVKHKEVTNE